MSKKLLIILILIIITTFLSACGGSSNSILNTEWQWANINDGFAKDFVENPEDYVLVFHEDGTFSGKVDCNSISGTYEMNENELVLSLGPTTLAECGPNSRYDAFMGKLKYIHRYELKDTEMTLFLSDGSTRLGFKNGGPVE